MAGEWAEGAALMREPALVAEACERMLEAVVQAAAREGAPPPLVTVKHRLGVVDHSGYSAAADVDEAADLASSRRFVAAVAGAGVTRVQVHARKGLLGPAPAEAAGGGAAGGGAVGSGRSAALANRYVPPLRLGVVHALAREFPAVELVANGGVGSAAEAAAHLARGGVAGVMVGRGALNHPVAALHGADALFDVPPPPHHAGEAPRRSSAARGGAPATTRGDVLERYVAYVEREERGGGVEGARGRGGSCEPDRALDVFERLVAPTYAAYAPLLHQPLSHHLLIHLHPAPTLDPPPLPPPPLSRYNLFAGEEGAHAYRRRLGRLVGAARRAEGGRSHSAAAALRAAAAELPASTLGRPLSEFVPLEALPVYDFGPRKVGRFRAKVW